MDKFNTEAVILKHIKYLDTDKIYTLLSKDKGKISVIAKGVRKITSKRSGNLDTLNHVIIQINKHKSDQNYVSEIKTISTYKNIKKNYDLSKSAFYLVELISRTVWEDENSHDVFNLLVKCLDRLDENQEKYEITINKFEIKLMQLLGYEPPKSLLAAWRDKVRGDDLKSANMIIKNYVTEMLEETMKSLELD